MKMDRKLIGDSYEIYIKDHIKDEYDNVWLWRELPEKYLFDLGIIRNYDIFSKYRYDLGIDVVAMKNNKFYFIQCKNFKETISLERLAGFYFFLYEYNVEGILYYSGVLSRRVIELNTKIKFINVVFNNQSINKSIAEKMIPREYQLEAIKVLSNGTNSVLSLPCGMGKTFIASLIAQNYDNIIVLSPLKVLAQELLTNIYNNTNNKYNRILLSSDDVLRVEDVEKKIRNKNIISSTYHSAHIIDELYDNFKKCIIIIDEYHNLSKTNLTNKDNAIYKLINNGDKKLYLSATPNMEIKYDTIYNYKWKDAINNKYICDFDIVIPELNDDVNYITKILNIENTFNKKYISKVYFMLKSMLYFGNRKCIMYATTTDKAKKYDTIIEWLSKILNIELVKNIIDYKTSPTKRNKYLELFKCSDKLSIIVNVHILDEGINIEYCDSVFICNPNNNINNIIQRMCRCNRITKTKTKSNVYLWCNNKKVDKILNHIFGLTNNEINNKVIKYDCSKNEVIINKNRNENQNKNQNENRNKNENENEKNKIIVKQSETNYYYEFNSNKIYTIIDNNNEKWFRGKDVGEALKYVNIRDAIKQQIDEKNIISYSKIIHNQKKRCNEQPHSIYINKSGFYYLLINSNLDYGMEFKKLILNMILHNIF